MYLAVEDTVTSTPPDPSRGSVVSSYYPVRCVRGRNLTYFFLKNFFFFLLIHLTKFCVVLHGMLANVTPNLPEGEAKSRAVPLTDTLLPVLNEFYGNTFKIKLHNRLDKSFIYSDRLASLRTLIVESPLSP